MAVLVCPKCGSADAVRHCGDASRSCDLVRCPRCKAFGTADGSRWRTESYGTP